MVTKSIVGLEQPVRRLYSERLFYVFSGVFMVLSVFFPKLYIPFYLLISVVGYWLTRAVYVQWKWSDFYKKIPHVKPLFFMGHIGLVTPDTLIVRLKEFLDECGSIIGVWLPPGFAPLVAVADADSLRTIMSTTNTPKGMIMRFFERGTNLFDPLGSGWLGTGLLTSNGALWKSRRDLITPTFHFQILQNYMGIFQSRTKILASRLNKLAQEGTDKSHDIFPLCTDCTLDIIGACAFGLDLGCQTQAEPSNYVKAIREITEIVFARTFHPLHQSSIFFALSSEGRRWRNLIATVHQLPDRLISERRSYIAKHADEIESKKRLDFLDMLLTVADEEGNGLSDLAIRNEVDTFLFEGHDTTAAGLAWTLYCLAANPDYQRRAREEVDKVLQGPDHFAPTYEEAKSSFAFLELCIKEALRLYPPVPFIVRNSETPLELKGHHIPAGTEIILLIYGIQRSAEYWRDPDTFRPERFVEEGIKHPFSYVPFSAGHRSCVGQVFAMLEEKTILAMLLKQFEFTLDPATPVEPETYIILRPRHGVKLFIRRRT